MKKILAIEGKYSLVAFRLIILFLMGFFMLYGDSKILENPQATREIFNWMLALASIHLASNIALLFLPERIVSSGLTTGLFFLDTSLISLALYKTQGLQNDLFLIYFLVVFMTVISKKNNLSFLVAGLACFLYAFMFLKTNNASSLLHPEVMIRFPLLMVVAFFSSIIVQETEKSELQALQSLSNLSKSIFSKLKLENLLPSLADLTLRVIKADDVSILLLDKDKKFSVAAAQGLDPNIKNKIRLEIGEKSLTSLKSGTVLSLNTLAMDPQFIYLNEKLPISSLLIYPLLSKEDLMGILIAVRTQTEVPFSFYEEHYANVYVSLISQSIDNARLYKESENHVEELKFAYEKLSHMQSELIQSEKLAAIGQLAAGVAHELNNPLTSVLGLVDLLLTNENLTPAMKEDLKVVREESLQCSTIISNLLRFARKHPAQKIATPINEVVEQTLKLVHHELDILGIELIKDFDLKDPMVKVDPYQIQQVFLNLSNNAMDALKEKVGGKFTIQTKKEGEKVKVQFSDNGCGIPKKNLSHIFEPFFTTKDVGKGTGLGLSISYGIVRDHGGTIHVESQEGLGTTFWIELDLENSQTLSYLHAA